MPFRKTPEQLAQIEQYLTTPLLQTRRWSFERYMILNTRVAQPLNFIFELVTMPIQLVGGIFVAIPVVGWPVLLFFWLLGQAWSLVMHLITLPIFAAANLIVPESGHQER